MGPNTTACPHCGKIISQELRFCSECGKPIQRSDEQESEPKSGERPIPKGTIVGFQSPLKEVNLDRDESSASQRLTQPGVGESSSSPPADVDSESRPVRGKTMIGIPSQFEPRAGGTIISTPIPPGKTQPLQPLTQQNQAAPSTEADDAGESSSKRPGGYAKTMLGVAPAIPASAEPNRKEEVKPVTPGGTILGIPEAGGVELPPEISSEVEQPDESQPSSQDDASSENIPGISPETGRTMLGQAPLSDPPKAKAPVESRSEPAFETRERPRKKRVSKKKRGPFATLLVLGLGLAIVAAAGYLYVQEKKPKVQAKVVSLDDGEAMQFDVPGAPNGSKVRFGGQEQALVAGRATFRLAADSLRVGKNVVPVDYIDPSGKAESAKIALDVDFRIRVDTSPLQTDPPSIDVIVNAHPGTVVSLDGEPLKLDAKGSAVRRFPIDAASASTSGSIEKVVQYRVQPPDGEAAVDEIRTKLPVATMQIDRPGAEAITDKDAIEIAGAVAPNSQVTIDDQEIPVRAARFIHRYPLPKPGTYKPRLIAREPGKAPQARTVVIKRVTDLAKEAESFEADPKLTFVRIAQNPSIYTGQKVDMVGRVYNVNVQEGQSVLQILVRECPTGRRCSLWVTYAAATDVVVNSWIRVLGVIEGEQQFRSEKGQVVTVPKVAATFVLPIDR
jgi:hypothetical protein